MAEEMGHALGTEAQFKAFLAQGRFMVESTTGAVVVGREGSCCPTAFALPVPY